MDEYDEEIYERELQNWKEAQRWNNVYTGPEDRDMIPLRLYGREERTSWAMRTRLALCDKHAQGEDLIAFEARVYTPHRVRRFYRTVIGFHTGDLDLRGRFAPRYEDLFARWQRFSKELCRFKQHSRQHEQTLLDRHDKNISTPLDDTSFTITEGAVHPQVLSEPFCTNWHLRPGLSELEILYEYHEDVIACLAQHPEPKFQVLCFQGLPVELIHRVMEYLAENHCRNLGLCSRLLHDVSISYIYRRVVFKLTTAPDIWFLCSSFQTHQETVQFLKNDVDMAFEHVTKALTAIRQRPNALACIRSLELSDRILDQELDVWSVITHEDLVQRLVPLTELADEIISLAPGIEVCSILGFPLSSALLGSLRSLPRLVTMDLRMCIIDMAPAEIPCFDTVLNASLHPDGTSYSSTWNILPSLTSLRWLSMAKSRAPSDLPPPLDPSCLPPSAIRSASNVFDTLERLMLYDLPFEEVPDLIQWVRQARILKGPGLRLTHFKLEMRHGLYDEEILDIISALQGAPMRIFVLDGMADAEPDLFDVVADAFPGLESLTLIYRAGNRQREARGAQWPFSTGEYAAHFTGFKNLKHFGWNWKVEPVRITPRCMVLFEDALCGDWRDVATPSNEYFDDWKSIPRLFHAYCPTLESFHFTGGVVALHYRLCRADGVEVQIQDVTPIGFDTELQADEHNPSVSAGWPKFTQQDLKDSI